MENPPVAYENLKFLNSDACRSARLGLEYLHPEIVMNEHRIKSTLVLFGSARIPAPEHAGSAANKHLAEFTPYYEEARKLAEIISCESQTEHGCEFVIITGGGGGIMEAGNRGAKDAGCKSIALNITLPHEQKPNPYVTEDLCFRFHYFNMRKMHFMRRAKAVCIFPGGFGTLDELFEMLTLIQTGKIPPIPVILFGTEFWEKLINWDCLVESGLISPEDVRIFTFCEDAEEACKIIKDFYASEGIRH